MKKMKRGTYAKACWPCSRPATTLSSALRTSLGSCRCWWSSWQPSMNFVPLKSKPWTQPLCIVTCPASAVPVAGYLVYFLQSKCLPGTLSREGETQGSVYRYPELLPSEEPPQVLRQGLGRWLVVKSTSCSSGEAELAHNSVANSCSFCHIGVVIFL